MKPGDAVVAGLAVTTAVAAADMFSRVLPPAHTIAGQPATAAAIADVRRQCATVLPMVLALGIGASLLARSPWPLAGAGLGMAWMWWQYDTAAQHDGGSQPGAAALRGRYGS